ncbi:MAG: cytochrome c biogenesis heme-transporting ATPase CcmA [Pseudomonadota bacterium]
MTEFPLSLRDIVVSRGERCLLRGLHLDVAPGDLVHLVGPNGCGKTSLLRVIAGLSPPQSGEVLWHGEPIVGQRLRYAQSIAWLSHQPGLKADLSLIENLTFDNALRRRVTAAQLDDTLIGLGIASRRDVRAGGLSAGQRRRAALARVLMSDAPLWLLDEPLTNLDTTGRAFVLSQLQSHAAAGGMIVFAAHTDIVIANTAVRRLEWEVSDDE